MDEYWATRTGRWRKAMQGRSGPSFSDRLFAVVRGDISAGALPVGAILPRAERVAVELVIAVEEVRSAYARLLAESLIAERNDGEFYIPRSGDSDGAESVGDATQIRFEATLLRAVRAAAARGLNPAEASDRFRAMMERGEDGKSGE